MAQTITIGGFADPGALTSSAGDQPVTLFGPGGTRVIGGPAAETPASRALLNEKAALDAQAAQDAANSAAETARSTANANEADAYRIASGIAGSNADLEMQATAITALQEARKVRATIGAQRADVASAGFGESGTNLMLLRDSVAQGAITDALTRIQGNINVGGYRAQQAAAQAESDAAGGASQASQILAQQFAASGVLAIANSANLAATLAATDPLSEGGLFGPGSFSGTDTSIGAGAGATTGFTVRPSRDPFGISTGPLVSNPSPSGGGSVSPDATPNDNLDIGTTIE